MNALPPTDKKPKLFLEIGEERPLQSAKFEVAMFSAIFFGSWINLIRLLL